MKLEGVADFEEVDPGLTFDLRLVFAAFDAGGIAGFVRVDRRAGKALFVLGATGKPKGSRCEKKASDSGKQSH
ncbi:MAG: hypothetical protein SNJ84_05660 [Verrucomicrobiia bacterium]